MTASSQDPGQTQQCLLGLCTRAQVYVPGPRSMCQTPGLCARPQAYVPDPRPMCQAPGLCARPQAYVPGPRPMYQAPGLCTRPQIYVPGPRPMFQAPGLCIRSQAHVPGLSMYLSRVCICEYVSHLSIFTAVGQEHSIGSLHPRYAQ